jgi:cyclophilin family peptidyl-prolyl cis-trans isomerase
MSRRKPSTSSIRPLVLLLIVVVLGLLIAMIIYQNRAKSAAANAPAPSTLQWSSPPAMTIDTTKSYFATLQTAKGDIRIELLASQAPRTVNNFVFLARAGFYDGTTFHRVLQDFMAQGGDPTGTGAGGPGYKFEDEFTSALTFSEPGMVAMANSGPNTNGSQFFITFAPVTYLNGKHTIFGKVVKGMDVALSLTLRDPNQDPNYLGDVIQKVTIEESTTAVLTEPTITALAVAPEMQPGRPLAALAVSAREGIFSTPPAMAIDLSHTYQAIVETTKGKILIELNDADAPRSVNNFVILANLGYWDHFPFSGRQAGQWVCTGALSGNHGADIGYSLPSETKLLNVAGAIGFWSSPQGEGSSGSSIYILLQDNRAMDGMNTVFGKVTDGLDVASTLTTADRIENISILEK